MLTEVKSQHQSMMTMLWKLMNTCKGDTETMVGHHKQFMNAVDVVQGQWGESHPEKLEKVELGHNNEKNIKRWQTGAMRSFQLVCLCTGQTKKCMESVLTNQIACI